MVVKKIFSEDLQIAKSLIVRDDMVTRKYFYQQCYPLFKSIFDNYYTDCANVKEFIDEMYIIVLAPSKLTGKCQMENFRGESTLTSWLKTACLFYCYKQFEIKASDFKTEDLIKKYGRQILGLTNENIAKLIWQYVYPDLLTKAKKTIYGNG